MTLNEHVADLHSRRWQFKAASVYTFMGSAEVLASWLNSKLVREELVPEQILQLGLGRGEMGGKAIVTLLDTFSPRISVEEAMSLTNPQFGYLHLLSAIEGGAFVAVADGEWNVSTAERALRALTRGLIRDGLVLGTRGRTLMFMGHSSHRCKFLAWQRSGGPVIELPTALEGDACYAMLPDHTVLGVHRHTGKFVCLRTSDLFETTTPVWHTFEIKHVAVEGMTTSPGTTPTVLLTCTLEDHRLMVPAVVLWLGGTRFAVSLARGWAVPYEPTLPPLVGLRPKSGNAVLMRYPSSDTYDTVTQFEITPITKLFADEGQDEFVRLATDAAQGTIFQRVAHT